MFFQKCLFSVKNIFQSYKQMKNVKKIYYVMQNNMRVVSYMYVAFGIYC